MGQPELKTFHLADEQASTAFGQRLVAKVLDSLPANRAFVIHLRGPLGAGKTTLARAMLRAAGVEGQIRSPTYTLVETYEPVQPPVQFVHVDLYRIAGRADADGLGLREYDRGETVWLVEWPERAAVADRVDLVIELAYKPNGDGRRVQVSGPTGSGAEIVAEL